MPVLIRLFTAGRLDLRLKLPPDYRLGPSAQTILPPVRSENQPSKYDHCPHFKPKPDQLSHQSQSLSRSYGSVLPTSLTYIFLFDQRLFTLETCCGYGYGLARKSYSLTQIFKGRLKRSGHHEAAVLFGQTSPLSPVKPIPGARLLTKKRQLFPGL